MLAQLSVCLNQMVGATGTFTNLHYPDQAVVPGLFDSESQSGSVFYALRVSRVNYVTVSYDYARLLSFPTAGQNETRTQAILFSYTYSPSKRFSFSVFGGPQYADISRSFTSTVRLRRPGSQSWTGAGGASMGWQGKVTSVAVSYSHVVANGGGLMRRRRPIPPTPLSPAHHPNSGSILECRVHEQRRDRRIVSGRDRKLQRTRNSGTASLQQQLGQHMSLQLGYTHLHQNYNVAAISATPDTNRELSSVSYEFSRPLGR